MGQAITYLGEMRFVAAIENSTTVFLNAAFNNIPTAGSDDRDHHHVCAGGEPVER